MMTLDCKKSYIKVSSPSNIAFVKYWGKYGDQLPINPSLSMTLQNCISIFDIKLLPLNDSVVSEFKFEEKENNKFKERIEKFLIKHKKDFSVLSKYSLEINCENTFPHSSGIASSASSMSAIVFGLIALENKGNLQPKDLERASRLSRLASGSASRSLFPGIVQWGRNSYANSSDDYAVEFKDVHKVFMSLLDSVLIIDNSEKEFSSSFGHSLMANHVFKDSRVKQAHDNMLKISSAISSGNLKEFGEVLENEALTLHGLMMTSEPSVILLKPNSLKVIELIKAFRKKNGLHLYFTIDAGANIHLIYPDLIKDRVLSFIEDELKILCINERVIHDRYGSGPKILESNFHD